MKTRIKQYTNLFNTFIESEKSSGIILIFCTVLSMTISNLPGGQSFIDLFHTKVDLSFWKVDLNLNLELWINDGLMTIFFLLVGLEIEREFYVGELKSIRKALLPVIAAVGGMLVPALIHFYFNKGTATQHGFAIPMATDIAFALGVLSLAGNRVPVSLKIFLTALAIIDDLGAILMIAIFYTDNLKLYFLTAAIVIFIVLLLFNKFKVKRLVFYILPGMVMWYCMLQSGVHATISGVLLAFTIPFNVKDEVNLSDKLMDLLHSPVAFFIIPLFALANTAIQLPSDIAASLTTANSLGIVLGLTFGKLTGVFLFTFIAVKLKITALYEEMNWLNLFGVSWLTGIGFTMSIFIANLAFTDLNIITQSKLSILCASIIAALIGLILLRKICVNKL